LIITRPPGFISISTDVAIFKGGYHTSVNGVMLLPVWLRQWHTGVDSAAVT